MQERDSSGKVHQAVAKNSKGAWSRANLEASSQASDGASVALALHTVALFRPFPTGRGPWTRRREERENLSLASIPRQLEMGAGTRRRGGGTERTNGGCRHLDPTERNHTAGVHFLSLCAAEVFLCEARFRLRVSVPLCWSM